MSFSLIVPIAANKKEYKKQIPEEFLFTQEGLMRCVRAIMGIDLTIFSHIYFTILRKHSERYFLKELLETQFKRLGLEKAMVVELEHHTYSQPATVYETIKLVGISGCFMVKDADCYLEGEVLPENSVAVYPLEKLDWVDPQHKSYVAVDDMSYVTNIIEKRIISHYFCAGAYVFESTDDYCQCFESLRGNDTLYLSHIIYKMLLHGNIFRPIIAKSYIDFNIRNQNC